MKKLGHLSNYSCGHLYIPDCQGLIAGVDVQLCCITEADREASDERTAGTAGGDVPGAVGGGEARCAEESAAPGEHIRAPNYQGGPRHRASALRPIPPAQATTRQECCGKLVQTEQNLSTTYWFINIFTFLFDTTTYRRLNYNLFLL